MTNHFTKKRFQVEGIVDGHARGSLVSFDTFAAAEAHVAHRNERAIARGRVASWIVFDSGEA